MSNFEYGIPVITEEQHKEVARWCDVRFPVSKKCICCNDSPEDIGDKWITDYGMLVRYEPATGQTATIHTPLLIIVCPSCFFIYSFPLFESGALTPPESEEQPH